MRPRGGNETAGPPAPAGQSIKVILVGCRGLLGELIVDAVAHAPDLEVVSNRPDDVDLAELAAQLAPDVIVWNNADEALLAGSVHQFGRCAQVKVIATADDGRRAALWQLLPHQTPLGELSPTSLVASIREAASR